MESTFQNKHALNKDYKRSFSTSKGHYAGFQMTIAVEHETLRPLAILIYPGSPNDAKIFDKMMHELKRRRLLKKGQLVIADKGFYNACNYLTRINKYKIVPLVFPRKKPTLKVLKDKIIQSVRLILTMKINPDKHIRNYETDYSNYFLNGRIYAEQDGKIEKVFQFLKENLGLGHIHAYTKRSVYKKAYLNVLLLGILISNGQNEIKEIYTMQNFT
ncbi:MAG: transposase [Methanobacterium sp.]|nr:transposase [Methanobacterium sp.]